jgi:hypothetical protein
MKLFCRHYAKASKDIFTESQFWIMALAIFVFLTFQEWLLGLL